MKEFITTKELATLLGIAPNTLEARRCRGEGPPFIRCGRSVRYPWIQVVAWLGLTDEPLPNTKPGMTAIERMEAVLGQGRTK
jgi:hypothetical protein